MSIEFLEKAFFWTDLGFTLIPVQPNSKDNISGFGLYLDQLQSTEDILFWYNREQPPNLAVVAPAGYVLLDFDDIELYKAWYQSAPIVSGTYTERTPSGGAHVVIQSGYDPNIKRRLKKGVEIKQAFIVAPSVVAGKPYTVIFRDIRKESEREIFTDVLLCEEKPTVSPVRRSSGGSGLLDFLKSAYDCVDILEGRGVKIGNKQKRFATCHCPFHDDNKPSFWIDQVRNLWGCHACDLSGDVINLYAELEGLTVRESIAILREGIA